MRKFQLNIGDVATASGNAHYTCFGLGSCIGLFIQDRVTGLSGGAHIFLPDAEASLKDFAKYYSVTQAIDEIIARFKMKGSMLDTLRAKVTGGANVLGVKSHTGIKNSEAVMKQLIERKIFLAAVDVGGSYYRTANFDSETGILNVKIPQLNQFKTY